MATRITRDHHLLTRNLKLNDNYLSNDGGDEGISIADDGAATITSTTTTGKALQINSHSLTAGGNNLLLDINDSLTTSDTKTLAYIDYDKSGVTASGQLSSTTALEISMADAATNNASGNVLMIGARITLDSASADGTIVQNGLVVNVATDSVGDAANTNGITTTVMDGGKDILMQSSADTGDYCSISTTTHGATTIATVDDDATAAHLTLDADGIIYLDSGASNADVIIQDAGNDYIQFKNDAVGNTSRIFLFESPAGTDYCSISTTTHGATTIQTRDFAGSAAPLTFVVDGHVEFDGCGVGFDLVTPSYDATATVVDFKTGNKQMVTFGSGDITNVEFHFPSASGNFVCLFKQDGTGSRTITNYKVYDAAGNTASGSSSTKFAGGSNPTLTTDANHVDIISIFWDADNEIAYAVATLDFQF